MNQDLKFTIKKIIRNQFSPRHSPDEVYLVKDIPYTLSGKKMETPVKNLFLGKDIKKVVNRDAMKNPGSFDYFVDFKKDVIDNLI